METCGSKPCAEGWKGENSNGFGCRMPGKRGQMIGRSRKAGVPGSATILGCRTPASAPFSVGPAGREHPTTARPSPSSKQLISCSANADLSPPGAAAHPTRTAPLSLLQLIPVSACEEGRSPARCGDRLPQRCPACLLLLRHLDFVLANGINKCTEGPLELAAAGLCLKVCSPFTGEGSHADLLDRAAPASLAGRMEQGGKDEARAIRESEHRDLKETLFYCERGWARRAVALGGY